MNEIKLWLDSLPRGGKTNSICWDQYFMGIAKLAAVRSKDPCTKVGACIVKNNKIISTGYNGFPSGLSNDKYPWTKSSNNPVENKFYYVIHAELNAILNAKCDLSGAILYVSKFPCNECAKAIIQSGIKKVIYDEDPEESNKNIPIILEMFKDAEVNVVQFLRSGYNITIEL